MRALVLVVVLGLALSACGRGSGSNPFGSVGSIGSLNPFGGGSRAEQGAEGGAMAAVPDDGTVLATTLEAASAEAALRGVILRATALQPTQGYYGARLVALNRGVPDENGILVYEFRLQPPVALEPTGPQRTRRILAASFVHDNDLGGVRGFQVISQQRVVNIRR